MKLVVGSKPPCFPHSRVMEPIRRYVKPLSMLATALSTRKKASYAKLTR